MTPDPNRPASDVERTAALDRLAILDTRRPLPRTASGGIVGIMPARRSAETTPDLFSTLPMAKAPEPQARPTAAPLSAQRPYRSAEAAGECRNRCSACGCHHRGRAPWSVAADRCEPTTPSGARRAWHWFIDNWQAERSARRFQSWRQARGDCAAVRDFTVRCPQDARQRGARPKI